VAQKASRLRRGRLAIFRREGKTRLLDFPHHPGEIWREARLEVSGRGSPYVRSEEGKEKREIFENRHESMRIGSSRRTELGPSVAMQRSREGRHRGDLHAEGKGKRIRKRDKARRHCPWRNRPRQPTKKKPGLDNRNNRSCAGGPKPWVPENVRNLSTRGEEMRKVERLGTRPSRLNRVTR